LSLVVLEVVADEVLVVVLVVIAHQRQLLLR
jgi:hypothetical protein